MKARRFVAVPLFLATTALLAVGIVSCKQGEGERCQVDSDCDTGLVCNQATQQCAGETAGGIDATVPDGTDAPDAPPDAPPDGARDAPRD
ncbi:MAG TPA: hypothetical protein VFQ53_28270 [Kofleriaceae bacterium]|nr:hypothetical protein [Kofleriaceae bacterium]